MKVYGQTDRNRKYRYTESQTDRWTDRKISSEELARRIPCRQTDRLTETETSADREPDRYRGVNRQMDRRLIVTDRELYS